MKAVITVMGKDTPGIVAKVSAKCFEYGGNILDVTQTLLQEYFAMIMLVDITSLKVPFVEFIESLEKLGDESGLKITTMHEDLFNSMHKI